MRAIKTFIEAVVVFGLLYSCNKEANLNGQATLQGHLYTINPYGTNLPVAAPGQTICLNDNPDTSFYIYKTVTDSLGEYAIPALKKGTSYVLFARWEKDSVEY